MSYQSIGYDEFLTRIDDSSQLSAEMDASMFDNAVSDISSSKIQGGALISNSGKLFIDLENDVIRISDGSLDLINLGVLSDGSTGLELKDQNGTTIMKFTTSAQFLQAADKKMLVDFIKGYLLVKNDFEVPIVVLGALEE
jgi:hypothetical protein